MLRTQSLVGVMGLILAFAVGCGPSGPKEPTSKVTGTVTLDGNPLAKGMILFESPEDAQAGRVPGQAEIVNGKYEAEVVAGKKTVKISSEEDTGKEDDTGVKITRELVPEQYNAESTLQREVTASGPNTFNFDLKSR